VEALWQDVKYGARTLGKTPGFTVIAILTLALGIGANTAIFSVVEAVLLRTLPYAESERLAIIWEDASFAGFPRNTPAPANFVDWKAQNHTFEDMAAIANRSLNITGDGEPERAPSQAVTHRFFSLLGVRPPLGRDFRPEDDMPGAHRVVILSHSLWQTRYGADPNVLGREILLSGEKYSVIGVLPARFQFLDKDTKLWIPAAFTNEELTRRGNHYLRVVGRLRPGVTPEQADADIAAVTRRIAQEFPNEAGRLGSRVVPIREEITTDVRQPLLMLLIAVGFVLLIACANLANLQLSRATAREREIAVRTALGAGRARIVRQLLTECLVLSLAGGSAGALLSWWSFDFLRQLVPPGMLETSAVEFNGRILSFTIGVAFLAAVMFGLAPALHAFPKNLGNALKQGGRSGIAGAGSRLRSMLVAGEVALAMILLVGAGLMLQTVFHLRHQYANLRAETLLTLRTELPGSRYGEHARRTAFYDGVLERVRALPGVVSAAYTTSTPLVWKGGTSGLYPENLPINRALSYDANFRQVSPDYFRTVGIAVRDGRVFDDHDTPQSLPVAVINETLARHYWPGANPVGRRFKPGDPDEEVPWFTVVGIVADVRQMGIDAPVKDEMYFSHRQVQSHSWFRPRDLVVRAGGDPAALIAGVRAAVREADPSQPISYIRTMEDVLDEESAPRRIGTSFLAGFSLLALLLAAIGIYGVLAYFVGQHRQEIGVRMALGATPRKVLRLVLGKGMLLVATGVGVGLLGALALSQLMAKLLFGVSAVDPLTYLLLPPVLTGIALLACWIPARRATRVDPMVALRYE
jgi:putative ABC transport system permease protein